MKAHVVKRLLKFNQPAGTSRGVLLEKPSWYIVLENHEQKYSAMGEVSVIPGLSIDPLATIDQKLGEICDLINSQRFPSAEDLSGFPAIKFGLETAMLDYEVQGGKILFSSDFTQGKVGVPTNGLVWMGSADQMLERVDQKLKNGFTCLKFKIGAINLEDELSIIRKVREKYSADMLEIRVDANGAFSVDQAPFILDKLAALNVHSIEQPIRQGQWKAMYKLCLNSPVPVALDEELIGIKNKAELLDAIKPPYIILKPGLLGGLAEADEWISLAEKRNINWWATSALESNIGLNAISQWVAAKNTSLYQGLGLGNLYQENIQCPLELIGEKLFYNPAKSWNYDFVS